MTEEEGRVPFTLRELIGLFLRDAAAYEGLDDDTVCSFGWWKKDTEDEHPRFNARLKVPLGELRKAFAEPISVPAHEEPGPPPTDAQWYSYLAMIARGKECDGEEERKALRRHIRAALDKVNALETELERLR